MATPGLTPDSRLSSTASPSATIDCPDCHSRHDLDGGHFCEICGYNFASGTSGGWPGFVTEVPEATAQTTAQTTGQIPAQIPAQIPGQMPAQTLTGWNLTIAIDPSLWEAAYSPEPPIATPEDLIPHIALSSSQALIGRTSRNRAIHPEVPLNFDNAVSQRHALIHLQGDRWLIRDLDSSNGTRLNGQELPPLADRPLKGGDRITLGHWTCITVIAP